MSDNTQPTTPVPAENGTPTPTGTPAQPAPTTTPPAAAQPYRTFADQAELDSFVKSSKGQAERAAIRKLAKELGFEDADEMRESLQTLRQAQGGGASASPTTPDTTTQATTPAGPSPTEARLTMALQVGAKLNLPAALIARLQGDTLEAMEADAQQLVGLMGTGARGPGIPPVPEGNRPVTITTAQLQDPKWVREHQAEIQLASREGRIVRS
jgi:hypothetical protein